MTIYEGDFNKYEDITAQTEYGDEVPPEKDILFAGYDNGDYEGHALIVFTKDGQLYENNDTYCSCNGLEYWSPELTSKEVLLKRTGWDGLAEALKAYTAPVVH